VNANVGIAHVIANDDEDIGLGMNRVRTPKHPNRAEEYCSQRSMHHFTSSNKRCGKRQPDQSGPV
jgi:hypothetical protein